MNIDKMINMLLIKLSQKNSVFYMERRTYKNNKVYKTYIIKTNDSTKEFNSKRDLLLYLSK